MKIDKASLAQSKRTQRQIAQSSAEAKGPPDLPPQALTEAGLEGPNHPSNHTYPLSASSRRSLSPIALITFLVLAFGAGAWFTRLATSAPSSTPIALIPATPMPIQPSPTPLSTATATSLDGGDVLETLYIDIMPADYQRIIAKRTEALRIGILLATGADYVPAIIRLGRDEIPVELRLKGDWTDHIALDKWSFRVRTFGANYLLGMRVFSLQDPSTRSFINEWLFLENLRQEDVLAPRYHFVHVVLNGEYKGIYALEEGFSRELFEAQKRREGLIIRYDENLVWEYRAFYDDQLIPRGVNQFHLIDEFQTGQIEADPALAAQRDTAVGMLRAMWTRARSAAQVFDLERMGRFLALTDLWSAPHGLIWHNLRYYYNPITVRLEPIAFDADALAGEHDQVGLPQNAFYHDPALQAAYVQASRRISQAGYVEGLENKLGVQFEKLRTALEPEFGPDVLVPPWDLLRRRQELFRQTLNPYQTVYAYVQSRSPQSATLIDVGNLLDLPLEIVGLEVAGTLLTPNQDWVVPDSAALLAPTDDADAIILRPLAPDATFLDYVHLQVPTMTLPFTKTRDLRIVTQLWGLTEPHIDDVLPRYPSPSVQGPLPDLPTLDQALAQHPYLQRVPDEKTLYLDSGTWEINGNLILPAGFGLRLLPGTTLRFGRDNFLLAGGALDFQGTDDAPVILQPLADEWKGIIVLKVDALSSWRYVTVERTSAVEQDGWTLTGGITFYESPIRLAHSRILNSRAEDSLNVIRAHFEFVHSEFGGSVSDALDVDFGQGTVQDCSFHDIGGDGIDISGSDIQVRRVTMLNVADKGISVGEASQLAAYDVHFENVGFGMVSKDLSHATLERATISGAQIAGLAAYIKKTSYGPATLTASEIEFRMTDLERHTLVQTGSWIELEGRRIGGSDFDVDALYQR